MKKAFILIALLLVTSTTLAYTIYYTRTVQVNENVGVGNTVKTVEGLNISLLSKEQGNLTYYALEETATDKHTLTYVYEYEIIAAGNYDIVVSVLGNDIEIVQYTVGSQIEIEFGLDQDKEFTQGDVLNITFEFELIEHNYNGFTTTNPFNPNTATEEQMIQLGLSDIEIQRTMQERTYDPIDNLTEWAIDISVAGFAQKYEQQVLDGYIVFE